MTCPPGQRRRALERQLGDSLPGHDRLELVLVTDLDGTLLAGSRRSRRRFYRWLAQQRPRVLHVFSTGRHLRSVERLLHAQIALGLARPHLVISDVGCTVACGATLAPLPQVVAPIEALWRGCDARVRPLLEGLRGLSAQPVAVERRLAYLIEPDRLDLSRLAAIEAHGVDCLISAGRYLDVLPPGVNKGSTLMDLLAWLEVDPSLVVTAGDSLNDLAMFQTGLRGVVVGNAEPELLAAVRDLPHVHRARAHGCAGIVEGLRQFGFGPLLAGFL